MARLRASADAHAALASPASTAIFLADKLCALTADAMEDRARLAKALARDGQHRRALTVLRRGGDEGMTRAMRVMAGECLYAMRDYEGCLEACGGGESPPEAEAARARTRRTTTTTTTTTTTMETMIETMIETIPERPADALPWQRAYRSTWK